MCVAQFPKPLAARVSSQAVVACRTVGVLPLIGSGKNAATREGELESGWIESWGPVVGASWESRLDLEEGK